MSTRIQQGQDNPMGSAPINKLIISMGVPIMISMLFQALYNIVDSIFVSQYADYALTAVSLAYPVQLVMIAVGVGTGVGINALLSRSLGEGNMDTVNKTAGNGLLTSLLNTVVFMIFGFFFVNTYFSSMTDTAETLAEGVTYLRICCIFSGGVFFQITTERLLQATGRSKLSMVTQIFGVVINIALDPILIFGMLGLPAMGAAGAAIATVSAQIIAAVLGLYLNFKYNKEITLHLKYCKPRAHVIARIYKVGLPSIIMQSIGSIMLYFMNIILLTFSESAATAMGLYYKLQSFFIMPVLGLNNCLIPIIAFNYGAGNADRIRQAIKTGIVYAIIVMLVGLAIFQIFPEALLGMFDASEDLLAIGVTAMRILSLCFVFAGFCIISSGVFQALGNGVYSLFVSFARQIGVIIPVAYLLSLTGDVNAVWWAMPIAEMVSVGLSALLLVKINKDVIKNI